ncbi:MAG: alpha/beta-hydrolase family protein [Corynebacteriales bacterium]|nr:alpha/beta-hydrolase family protein [Mycobacteriales bacterium]
MTPGVRRPRRAGVLGAAIGAVVAAAPGSLPRDPLVHAATLGVTMTVGFLAGSAIGRLAHLIGGGRGARVGRLSGTAAAVAVAASMSISVWWQNVLRGAMGMPEIGTGWAAASVAVVAVGVAALVAPRPTTLLASAVVLTGTGVAQAAAVPAAPTTSSIEEATVTRTADRLVISAPFDARPVAVRARDLVARWRAAGGARRGAVVVAVPTGSGWVDTDAVVGFETRLHGDVMTIALPYDDAPSWQAFVGGAADVARSSAVATLNALDSDLDDHPTHARPQIYLYGQSLGAIGADAARIWARHHRVAVCATLLAGPPAHTVASRADHREVVVNASDPVGRWSPSLLWRPAPRWPGHDDLPRPVWLPVASFLQTSVDLLGALSFPAGHGHQYGPEQSAYAPICAPKRSAHPDRA